MCSNKFKVFLPISLPFFSHRYAKEFFRGYMTYDNATDWVQK